MRYAAILTGMATCCLGSCVQRGDVLTQVSEKHDASTDITALDVICGDSHTGAISNGVAYFWGANDQGQLGTGDNQSQTIPVAIKGFQAWRQLAAGAVHSCALDDVGQVYCWGSNARGQLGQGDRVSRAVPTKVTLPEPATQISTKFGHSCALLINADLYCWGANSEGQLGQADQPPSGDDTLVDGLNPLQIGAASWRAVDTGDGHTCAINLDGSLWCWGRNSEHELGADSRIQVREPIQVTSNGLWLGVAAGQNHTCATMQDFTLWCWGQNTGADTNDGFPLGIAGATQVASPTQVGTSADWTLVRSNTFHSCALNRGLELWCWGRNIEGQLGASDFNARSEPAQITTGTSLLSVGRFTTCAISEDGVLGCTGTNNDGELGTGDYERRSSLTTVALVSVPQP